MRRRQCIGGLMAAPFVGTGHAAQGRVRVGLTGVILADQVGFLSRWSAYLQKRTGVAVDFAARDSYQAILDLLLSNQLDAAWICGYPFVRFEHELQLFAVPLYHGEPLYQAYLIRPAGTRLVEGWRDLKDKVLAYSDPLSNSGWLVAQAELARAHVLPQELRRGFFTHSHRNVAEAVAARLAQAGSIDGYVWETMKLQGMPAVAKTEIVWRSAKFGFPPLVTRKGSDSEPVRQLRSALLDMHASGEGSELLHALNLTGFAAGSPSLFDSIRRQAAQVPGSGVLA